MSIQKILREATRVDDDYLAPQEQLNHLEMVKYHLRVMPYGDFMKVCANSILPAHLWKWIHDDRSHDV